MLVRKLRDVPCSRLIPQHENARLDSGRAGLSITLLWSSLKSIPLIEKAIATTGETGETSRLTKTSVGRALDDLRRVQNGTVASTVRTNLDSPVRWNSYEAYGAEALVGTATAGVWVDTDAGNVVATAAAEFAEANVNGGDGGSEAEENGGKEHIEGYGL